MKCQGQKCEQKTGELSTINGTDCEPIRHPGTEQEQKTGELSTINGTDCEPIRHPGTETRAENWGIIYYQWNRL